MNTLRKWGRKMTKIALFPGSFDPFTNGHLDTVERTSKLFDQVVIAVATNTSKNALFSLEEKMMFIKQSVEHIENISVKEHSGGLTVELAKKIGAVTLVRGLRNNADFEYESTIATMNKIQHKDIETVFLMSNEKYRFLSSSLIKEVAMFGGDVSSLVPVGVNEAIKKKYAKIK